MNRVWDCLDCSLVTFSGINLWEAKGEEGVWAEVGDILFT